MTRQRTYLDSLPANGIGRSTCVQKAVARLGQYLRRRLRTALRHVCDDTAHRHTRTLGTMPRSWTQLANLGRVSGVMQVHDLPRSPRRRPAGGR